MMVPYAAIIPSQGVMQELPEEVSQGRRNPGFANKKKAPAHRSLLSCRKMI